MLIKKQLEGLIKIFTLKFVSFVVARIRVCVEVNGDVWEIIKTSLTQGT